jgi:hypothetical protein
MPCSSFALAVPFLPPPALALEVSLYDSVVSVVWRDHRGMGEGQSAEVTTVHPTGLLRLERTAVWVRRKRKEQVV